MFLATTFLVVSLALTASAQWGSRPPPPPPPGGSGGSRGPWGEGGPGGRGGQGEPGPRRPHRWHHCGPLHMGPQCGEFERTIHNQMQFMGLGWHNCTEQQQQQYGQQQPQYGQQQPQYGQQQPQYGQQQPQYGEQQYGGQQQQRGQHNSRENENFRKCMFNLNMLAIKSGNIRPDVNCTRSMMEVRDQLTQILNGNEQNNVGETEPTYYS